MRHEVAVEGVGQTADVRGRVGAEEEVLQRGVVGQHLGQAADVVRSVELW